MRAIVLAGLVVLAGCSDIDEAKQLVAAEFRDPDSLNWRNVRDVSDAIGGDYVCGEVNGRNGYGGYAGYRRFVVDMKTKSVVLEPAPSATGNPAVLDLERATYGLAATSCDL